MNYREGLTANYAFFREEQISPKYVIIMKRGVSLFNPASQRSLYAPKERSLQMELGAGREEQYPRVVNSPRAPGVLAKRAKLTHLTGPCGSMSTPVGDDGRWEARLYGQGIIRIINHASKLALYVSQDGAVTAEWKMHSGTPEADRAQRWEPRLEEYWVLVEDTGIHEQDLSQYRASAKKKFHLINLATGRALRCDDRNWEKGIDAVTLKYADMRQGKVSWSLSIPLKGEWLQLTYEQLQRKMQDIGAELAHVGPAYVLDSRLSLPEVAHFQKFHEEIRRMHSRTLVCWWVPPAQWDRLQEEPQAQHSYAGRVPGLFEGMQDPMTQERRKTFRELVICEIYKDVNMQKSDGSTPLRFPVWAGGAIFLLDAEISANGRLDQTREPGAMVSKNTLRQAGLDAQWTASGAIIMNPCYELALGQHFRTITTKYREFRDVCPMYRTVAVADSEETIPDYAIDAGKPNIAWPVPDIGTAALNAQQVGTPAEVGTIPVINSHMLAKRLGIKQLTLPLLPKEREPRLRALMGLRQTCKSIFLSFENYPGILRKLQYRWPYELNYYSVGARDRPRFTVLHAPILQGEERQPRAIEKRPTDLALVAVIARKEMYIEIWILKLKEIAEAAMANDQMLRTDFVYQDIDSLIPCIVEQFGGSLAQFEESMRIPEGTWADIYAAHANATPEQYDPDLVDDLRGHTTFYEDNPLQTEAAVWAVACSAFKTAATRSRRARIARQIEANLPHGPRFQTEAGPSNWEEFVKNEAKKRYAMEDHGALPRLQNGRTASIASAIWGQEAD